MPNYKDFDLDIQNNDNEKLYPKTVAQYDERSIRVQGSGSCKYCCEPSD